MKLGYFGLLVTLFLIASFIIPARLADPAPANAQLTSKMEWVMVDTPDSEPGLTKAVFSPLMTNGANFTLPKGSEIIKLVVGNNGITMFALARIRGNFGFPLSPFGNTIILLKSNDGGISWLPSSHMALSRDTNIAPPGNLCVWDIAIAPDNPRLVYVALSNKGTDVGMNQQVWASQDAGANWENTQWPPAGVAAGTDIISAMDVTADINGYRKVLVGTRNGTAGTANSMAVMKMPGFGGWNIQSNLGSPPSPTWFTGDVIAAKFSPTFASDSTIVVLATTPPTAGPPATTGATYVICGVHDIAQNITNWESAAQYVEVKNATAPAASGWSPRISNVISGMLQLPSDFSGQSSSLRRIYVCTEAVSAAGPPVTPNQGVYRIDGNSICTLMDTTSTWAAAGSTPTRRVHSIALFGTYASSKLLIGETLGHSCQASVPVWFTDSPTVCSIPCWYPAKKPPTGAAGDTACTQSTQYYGNAYVTWSPTYGDRGVAYCVTAASNMGAGFKLPVAGDWTADEGLATAGWPSGLLNYRAFDESAFSLSRNNGETWNQLSLIDTSIVKLTDVAPSMDCKTVYLASANNGTKCRGFDSVWRSSENEAVVAPPLPALPIGQIWERVRTSPTATACNITQSNYAILRLAPDKNNGQIVFWAAGGGTGLADCVADGWNHYAVGVNTRAAAWSPDFGDYWSDLNPRISVQDMAAESSNVLYILDTDGNVQKMPYVGTAWSNSVQTVASNLGGGHSLDAQADGRVLVGNRAGASTPFPVAMSTNSAISFVPNQRTLNEGVSNVGLHVLMDTDYKINGTVYVANDNIVAPKGRIWRNKMPSGANIDWEDMVTGFTSHMGYYGIVQTNSKNVSNQGTLYASHAANAPATWSGVERTLLPLSGIPKPGIIWDCMDAAATYYQTYNVCFTLEPESLKLCGCLTQDTNTTLWAIDNRWYASNHTAYAGIGKGGTAYAVRSSGMLWAYVDCMAKKGPKLTMDDGTIIGCDPATGRAQEVNFTWEQLCIAKGYQLVVAKDKGMIQVVHDSGTFYFPPTGTLMSPTYIYFTSTGGGLLALSGSEPCLGAGSAGAWSAASQIPLECGHQYFWRVRVREEMTCDAVRSPWSDTRAFTIKAGFRVTTPYYGPQLLAPDNGCGCPCGAPICFSWSPFKETQEYKFELSTNADMSSPLVSTAVKTTAYQYTGTAKCNTNYFWRVQATKPAPSEWSAVFSFQTQKEAPALAPPAPAPETPMWVWVIIAIGAILVIVTLVLIFKTRRV